MKSFQYVVCILGLLLINSYVVAVIQITPATEGSYNNEVITRKATPVPEYPSKWFIYISNAETQKALKAIHKQGLDNFQEVTDIIQEVDDDGIRYEIKMFLGCIPIAQQRRRSFIHNTKEYLDFYRELEEIKGQDGLLEEVNSTKFPDGLLLRLSLPCEPEKKIRSRLTLLRFSKLCTWVKSESEYRELGGESPTAIIMIDDYQGSERKQQGTEGRKRGGSRSSYALLE